MTNTTDLLAELLALCAATVSVTVNQHRNNSEPIEGYLRDVEGPTPEVRAEMLARDTVVEVQAYPRTPVGFYYAAHWDLASALRDVLESVKKS